jgi:hypothetical protein
MGLSKFAPPSALAPGVHSRLCRCSEELLPGFLPRGSTVQRVSAFGPEMPHSGLVPPLPFLPTSAACSTWHFSGLLHPETDHGVRHVSGSRVLVASTPLLSRRLRSVLEGACRGIPKKPWPEGIPAGVRSGSEEPSRKSWGARKRVGFPLAFPCGVLPFGAFPSTTAVLRQIRLRVTLRPLVHAR